MLRTGHTFPLFILLFTAPSASAVQLSAGLDRTEAQLGDQLMLTISVEGAQQTTAPNLPPLDDFEVYSAGTSTSMQIINGRSNLSVNHRYVLLAKQAGIFTIGEISLEIGGKTYTTDPIRVKILPADQPATKPQNNDDAFITATLSKHDLFRYEGLVYTFRFYQRINVGEARPEWPDFHGFLTDDLGQQHSYETVRHGSRYVVTEIKKILFPQQAGTLSIQPTKLHCKIPVKDSRQRRRRSPFDDFFSSPLDELMGNYKLEPRVLSSKPLTINVRDLPDKPEDFSGLVGSFSLTGDMSKKQMQVGESTTLTLTVRGTGNVQAIPEPIVSNLEHFKVYPDKPTGKVNPLSDNLSGHRTFKKALVALKEGRLQIPGARLVYFNPVSERYETAQTPPFDLEVLPSSGTEELKLTEMISPSNGKVAVKILGEDLLPPHEGLASLEPQSSTAATKSFGLGGFVLPGLLHIALLLTRKRKAALAGDIALRRRKSALTKAKSRLKELRALNPDHQKRELVESASRLLREYLGDMLNTEGTAMTAAESAELLNRLNLRKEIVSEVHDLLKTLESTLYASNQNNEINPVQLDKRIDHILQTLSKEISKTVVRS